MPDSLKSQDGSNSTAREPSLAAPPVITLPKGGGAIRGIGEKFAANPVTGTGSMTVPIATSPGRAGFGPQLSLSYDSGAGNGPFGFGWSMDLPSITRKSDKGLPRYEDVSGAGQERDEEDVFVLAGAEDLVPLRMRRGSIWQRVGSAPRTVGGRAYTIDEYRPRVEGLFARIERWTDAADARTVFWRTISRDNITTWYGRSDESRISDPADPRRIYQWLICESSDGRGNVVVYDYTREDDGGIDRRRTSERGRTHTANRYLKRVRYGNHTSYLPTLAEDAAWPALPPDDEWLFELVLDYGEHDITNPKPQDSGARPARIDPFSTYRPGFEVRTHRLCRRALMFHHVPDAPEVRRDCLVHSTDFAYAETGSAHTAPAASFLQSVTSWGYRRAGAGYVARALPPLEFDYSRVPAPDDLARAPVRILDTGREALPDGIQGGRALWIDLDGEGLSGVLTEQVGAWRYRRNLGPDDAGGAHLAPSEAVASLPAGGLAGGQFLDLAADGQVDVVRMQGPAIGFFERTPTGGWEPFRPFGAWPCIDPRDPNLRFVDLTGDGHADILITEGDALVWHASLAEMGFAPGIRLSVPLDAERGPRLLFDDGTQSILLADMVGDGLSDLVRVRSGDICYWPNLGYGRFGAQVVMDNAPALDTPARFDPARLLFADSDGAGPTDLIYLHETGARLYYNQAGNGWSDAVVLPQVPPLDALAAVHALDLRGAGTACLVWSSPLPGDPCPAVRFIDLMGGVKPYLLIGMRNNLGAETRVRYAPSTHFYVTDRLAGKPWITHLHFPVQVVEQVEVHDHIANSRLVTRYAYHHGHFDGFEREFRGFGMVEQWDSESFGSVTPAGNEEPAWRMPPARTRTWYHTGAFVEDARISGQYAHEYWREGDASLGDGGLTEAQAAGLLLDDTVLPDALLSPAGTSEPHALLAEEVRQACRALKGALLRQEIYADDGSEAADRPYTVTERNYTVSLLQPQGAGRHAVFLTTPRETVECHYERVLKAGVGGLRADPRVSHTLVLAMDGFGAPLRTLAVGYPRRPGALEPDAGQDQTHMAMTVTRVAHRDSREGLWADARRIGVPVEARSFEIVRPPAPEADGPRWRLFGWQTLRELAATLLPANDGDPAAPWQEMDWDWRTNPAHAAVAPALRRTAHGRTIYRRDDLTAPLGLGDVQPLALPWETRTLVWTLAMLDAVFTRPRHGLPDAPLLENAPALLGGTGGDAGGYLFEEGQWWSRSGHLFYALEVDAANPAATANAERAAARDHFYTPRVQTDAFGARGESDYAHDYAVIATRDALGQTTSATFDWRVLAPRIIVDANGVRAGALFDALGMVVATALLGKPGQDTGDSLDGLDADLPLALIQQCARDPESAAPALLALATTRFVYDTHRWARAGQPPFTALLARTRHVSDPLPGDALTPIQISLAFFDGFGRELQRKVQAEAGDAPLRDALVPLPTGDVLPGPLRRTAAGIVQGPVAARWVGSGRILYNNKGLHVRQYEPFFSATPLYEPEPDLTETGVSATLCYDPLGRAAATLHPNATYSKIIFDPWRQEEWDANDTVLLDPHTDHDVSGMAAPAIAALAPAGWQTWHARRVGGALGPHEQQAAQQAAAHSNTPATTHFDALGRAVVTVAHNGFDGGAPILYRQHLLLDAQGQTREVRDSSDRAIARYIYDLQGRLARQESMEAGTQWFLADTTDRPIHSWESRGYEVRLTYDLLRRLVGRWLRRDGSPWWLATRTLYGTAHLDSARNLVGRVYQLYDGAGVVTMERYDSTGTPVESSRRLTRAWDQAIDWSALDAIPDGPAADAARRAAAEVNLEPVQPFTQSSRFDALGRPVAVTMPDGSVTEPSYNRAGLFETLSVRLRAAAAPATPFVTGIDYNARGQRLAIRYGSGAETTTTYDRETFRLTALRTTRTVPPSALDSALFANPSVVQELTYIYDPVGNLTRAADAALVTVIHAGQSLSAGGQYTYDPLYRLVEARGREHIHQTALQLDPAPGSRRDLPYVGAGHPNDLRALRSYIESFLYDPDSNLKEWKHTAGTGSWTRTYFYEQPSLLEPARFSNRLTRSVVGVQGVAPRQESYTYSDADGGDAAGAVTAINLRGLDWDEAQRLRRADLGVGTSAWYVYAADGTRVRKVIVGQDGARRADTLYLGGFEIERSWAGGVLQEQRETLHVLDDMQRIALVETSIVKLGVTLAAPQPLVRYQHGNHLGSSAVELDAQARLISYEEYHPYSTTAFQAYESAAEVSLKRYRATGKERDAETGFYFHGARYYLPWLGRWLSADPAGLVDGVNLYAYTRDNPIVGLDPTGQDTITIREVTVEGRRPDQVAADIQAKTGMRAYDIAKQADIKPDASQQWVSDVEDTLEKSGVTAPVAGPEPAPDAEPPQKGPAVVANNEPYDRRHRYITVRGTDGGPMPNVLDKKMIEVYATPEEAEQMTIDQRGELGEGFAKAAIGGVAVGGAARAQFKAISAEGATLQNTSAGLPGRAPSNGGPTETQNTAVQRGPSASLPLAQRIANVEPPPMNNQRTIFVTETAEGPTLVSGGQSDLTPLQKRVATLWGLTPVRDFPGYDAEPTAIAGAGELNLTPTRGVATNLVCWHCRSIYIEGKNFGRGKVLPDGRHVIFGPSRKP